MSINKCKFTHPEYNYQCDRDAVNNNYCIFHDPNYWKYHEDEVREEFYKLVKDAKDYSKVLVCRGFHLPSIDITGEFKSNVYFIDTEFEGSVRLTNAKFNGYVIFFGAEFYKEVKLTEVDFSKVALRGAKFNGEVTFCLVNFNGEARFVKTEFNYKVTFEEVNFNRRIFFTCAKFNDEAEFLNTEFNEIELLNVTFPTPNNNERIPVRFDYSTFRKRGRFISEKNPLNLEGVSFKGVDLTNVEFHNVKWGEKEEKLFYIFPVARRNIIIDEMLLDKNKNYGEVAYIYNQLRKNYESKLLFNEAAGFFIGEMEAMRSLLNSNRLRDKLSSFPYLLYKWLAMYGESVFLPLIVWTPVIIIAFALLRMNQVDILNAFTDSLAAYFQIPRNNQLIDIIERILAVPVLGSAFIALRRKFERKK